MEEEDTGAVAGEDTAVLVATLTVTTPTGDIIETPAPAAPPGPPPGAEGADLGTIEPAAGEPTDFFSTGEGGFGVDSTGAVTFSELAPAPSTGAGNNACGVVLSCPATGGLPPGQDGSAPGSAAR